MLFLACKSRNTLASDYRINKIRIVFRFIVVDDMNAFTKMVLDIFSLSFWHDFHVGIFLIQPSV